jgi:L-2-aminoadipate reductase
MTDEKLARVVSQFLHLPIIALPTDYPRPIGAWRVVKAIHAAELSEQITQFVEVGGV